ncbi:MAG: hypothetical protein OCD76_09320 [Reichenbachiella sp.]
MTGKSISIYFLPMVSILIQFVLTTPSQTYSHKKTILIIESYHSTYPWDQNYKSGLSKVIGDSFNIVNFEMDTKQLPPEMHKDQAHLAWNKYLEIKPDLVFLGDDNALKYLGQKFSATQTPVIYLGINNNPREYYQTRSQNMTGVLERPLLKRSVHFLQKLLNVKKVLILFDSGITAQIVYKESFFELSTIITSGIQIDINLISNYTAWQSAILSAKENGYDAIIVGLYHTIVNNNNVHVDSEEIVSWTSKNTTVPPFGFWKFAVGSDKTIGGYVLSGEEQGASAGRIALKIFSGTTPQSITPQTASKGSLIFSQNQLQKWGITLPKNIGHAVHLID